MKNRHAFSLIELLVALAVLAVVAGIIVPKFLNVRNQAAQTIVAQNIAELNATYQKWTALGGSVNCWLTDWGADGIPVDDSWSAPIVMGFLCETGASSWQNNSAQGYERQNGGVSAFGMTPGYFMGDSYGAGGSWMISLSATTYPSASSLIAEYSAASMKSSSPDGWYLFTTDWNLYFKIGNQAYLIYFEPIPVAGNSHYPGFWYNPTPITLP